MEEEKINKRSKRSKDLFLLGIIKTKQDDTTRTKTLFNIKGLRKN